MKKPASDPRQMAFDSYFSVPRPTTPVPGTFGYDREVRNLLARALKECPQSRSVVAAAMTDLIFGDAGQGEITKAQIDGWTAESHEAWRFPLAYLPAFIQATGAIWILEQLADKCGCRILVGQEALLAEWGMLQVAEQQIRARQKALQKALPDDIAERILKSREVGDA
jgi:hypothetical protein